MTATEVPASFDCRATAAVLESGGSLTLAGHVAALISVLSTGVSVKGCSAFVWCAIVYLAVRVKLDRRFFQLLADHPAEELDHWLQATGLRKDNPSRTIPERRRGALRLWRALVVAVVLEIGLMLVGVFRWLP